MTKSPLFSGFDGLMNLSRREGVDIRPTLLRVLADLYVQTNTHSEQEARQFVELTSRLIDRAQRAGTIRADATATDIGMIMCGVSATMGHPTSGFDWRRHLDLLIDALRPR